VAEHQDVYFARTRRRTCQDTGLRTQVSVSNVESRNGGILLNCPVQKKFRVAVAVSPFTTTCGRLSRIESTSKLCNVLVIHIDLGTGASVVPSVDNVKSGATRRSRVAESRVRTASAHSCSTVRTESSTLALVTCVVALPPGVELLASRLSHAVTMKQASATVHISVRIMWPS
jgi:hypothetical protein